LSFKRSGPTRDLHSFPTRRSSDLATKSKKPGFGPLTSPSEPCLYSAYRRSSVSLSGRSDSPWTSCLACSKRFCRSDMVASPGKSPHDSMRGGGGQPVARSFRSGGSRELFASSVCGGREGRGGGLSDQREPRAIPLPASLCLPDGGAKARARGFCHYPYGEVAATCGNCRGRAALAS